MRDHSIYPWAKWLDGKTWKLTPGTDYKTSEASFRASIYTAAKYRGLTVATTFRDGFFYRQATAATEEP